MRHFLVIIFFCFLPFAVKSQIISGIVEEYNTFYPLAEVEILNINNEQKTVSGKNGDFQILVKPDDLLEFRIVGFKTQRVRIPKAIPRFFKIELNRIVPQFVAPKGATGIYHNDSLRYGLLYARQLGKAKFTMLDVLQHPFSALSKHNREIWSFQDNYHWFQGMKYVEYAFSDQILNQLTGLPADSSALFRKRYAIPYAQLRSMKAYDLYSYIKQSVQRFRTGQYRGPYRLSN